MKKILAIGSHFDDIEIGCAGTIYKHIQKGDEVYFAITHTDEFRTGEVDNRFEEQDKSFEVIGLNYKSKYHFLFKEIDSDSTIIGDLDKVKPDIIFSPFEHDTHQHHRRTSIIAQAVGRKRNITTLFYDSGSTYNFYPNVFSVIDFNKKLEILNCYKSQIEHGAINLDIVQKKNSYWASIVSSEKNKFAEGFVVRKMIWEV